MKIYTMQSIRLEQETIDRSASLVTNELDFIDTTTDLPLQFLVARSFLTTLRLLSPRFCYNNHCGRYDASPVVRFRALRKGILQ
jgi:hypothetical protein